MDFMKHVASVDILIEIVVGTRYVHSTRFSLFFSNCFDIMYVGFQIASIFLSREWSRTVSKSLFGSFWEGMELTMGHQR